MILTYSWLASLQQYIVHYGLYEMATVDNQAEYKLDTAEASEHVLSNNQATVGRSYSRGTDRDVR